MSAKVHVRVGGVGDQGSAVGEIEFANPPLNLVTGQFLADLRACLTKLEERPDLRAVVVHQGEARAFCAGSDIGEFETVREAAAERKVLIENHVLRQLAHLPCATIAALDGAALGGGLELAMTCDLRVAVAGAQLGLPEARIGGLASNGSQRLTKLVGPARAKQMLFTGSALRAEQALQWGLVNEVVPDSALERARQIAAVIAGQAPLSVRLAKHLVDVAVDTSLDAGVVAGIHAQEEVFRSSDLLEGAQAFREKRAARFTGN